MVGWWCTLKNPVCTFKTPPCVHSKRLRVCQRNARVKEDTRVFDGTFDRHTRERFLKSTHAHSTHTRHTHQHKHESLTHNTNNTLKNFARRQLNTYAPNYPNCIITLVKLTTKMATKSYVFTAIACMSDSQHTHRHTHTTHISTHTTVHTPHKHTHNT